MNGSDSQRYEVLREMALSGVKGTDLEDTIRAALARTASVIGLQGASVYFWDASHQPTLHVSFAESEPSAARLAELESSLFRRLREENELVSAYMSFGGEYPCHTFTLPLTYRDKTLGAVIGLQSGDRTVVSEDVFLETLSAAISLQSLVEGGQIPVGSDSVEKERLKAIVETAVTINHEINNPLTAILGNVQLLLLRKDELGDELRAKLEVVETAATRIKDVTQRLMSLTSARAVKYTNGTNMIDISDSESESDDGDSPQK